MISPHSTVARYNGKTVIIMQYGPEITKVRFFGVWDKDANGRDQFVEVPTAELEEFGNPENLFLGV